MIGAIIGDIVGSRFEFNNHRSKEFELFGEGCFATDDSIMTLAVAKAIMETERAAAYMSENSDGAEAFRALLGENTVRCMQDIGRHYPNCGYGGRFHQWMFSDDPQPYHSFGNGAAMRVSPAGFAARDAEEALFLAEAVTAVTHNHPEGIKGAKATAAAIYMARTGADRREIKEYIERNYYPLDFSINGIRDSYRFNETCQETVPQAIECFLESTSFEDAIRTAISLGGDSDTIAAITGAIAESYYGVPDWMRAQALSYLDRRLRAVYDEWQETHGTPREKFRVLTKYIDKFAKMERSEESADGSVRVHEGETDATWFIGSITVFEDEFYAFAKEYPAYHLMNYADILESHGIEWSERSMSAADVSKMDAQSVFALITGAVRAEHLSGGALKPFFENGAMLKWLRRLREIDAVSHEQKI